MRTMTKNAGRILLAGAFGALLAAVPAAAQLPNPSVAALGAGDNYTALARGFGAIAWNPANLGLSGNPGGSFALFSVFGVSGLGPVDLSDAREYEGQLLSDAVKQAWLDKITAAGGEEGTAGGSITYLALQVGRIGFQLSTNVHAAAQIGPGAAELILFGNAGRTGDPVNVTIGASTLDAAVTSTAAFSFAQPIARGPDGAIALGATLKYTVGHVMVTGMDLGSSLAADPVTLDIKFPMVHSDTLTSSVNNGSGIGLDLGVGWERGPLTLGASLRNLFHTFEWDRARLHYRPGTALFGIEESSSDFDAQPFTNAPAAVQERIDDIDYAPMLAAGAAYRVRPELVVAADLRQRVGDSRLMGPATHAGAGLEYTALGFLPIRVGGAVQSGGYLLSAGIGLRFGVFNLGVAGVTEQTELGSGSRAMLTVSGGAR